MWNFNTNVALNVSVNAVLALILVIIEINCYLEGAWKKVAPHRAFLLWVGFHILYLYFDIILDLAAEFNPSLPLVNTVAVIKAFCQAMTFASGGRWIIALINEKSEVSGRVSLLFQIIPLFLALVLCCPILIGKGSYFDIVAGLHDPRSNISVYICFFYLYLIYVVLAIIKYRDSFRRGEEKFIVLATVVTNFIAHQDTWAGTPVNIIVCCFILILYFRMWNIRKMELLEVEKKLAEKELEMNEARLEAMVAQIQPHFLYNALSTASGLCHVDPEKASEVINDFGKYLRANLESLKSKSPIPVEKELEHVRVYLNLEEVRFGKRLSIEYNIKDTDFCLPALTIQPLAENAVIHGITVTSKPGTVRISTWCDDSFHYVLVEDDGAGFDDTKLIDNTKHFGVENVSGRLQSLVGGELIISSRLGIGTKAMVKIPKENKNENSGN